MRQSVAANYSVSYSHVIMMSMLTCVTTGSAQAAASDIHRRLPTHMADMRRDWLTNQNTDWCFVLIGLGRYTSHSPLQQLKIDHVRQTWSAIMVGI